VGKMELRNYMSTRVLKLPKGPFVPPRKYAGKDFIDLTVGNPDFSEPEHIKKAYLETVDLPQRYCDPKGLIELREEVSRKISRKNRVNYDPKTEILITEGSQPALDATFRVFLNEGDKVILPDPFYGPHNTQIILSGGIPVYVGHDELNLERIKEKGIDKIKMIVVCSPNNPAGVVYSRKVLEDIADIALEYDSIILSDEVYEDFVYDDAKHTSIASLNGMRERTVSIWSFSKTYNLTDLRLGYIAGAEEFMKEISKVISANCFSGSSRDQRVAYKAMTGPQDWISDMVKEYSRRREVSVRRLKEIGFELTPEPKGAIYVFPKIPEELNVSGEKWAESLDKEHGVGVIPGNRFSVKGEKNFRIAYTKPINVLEEAYNKMEKAFSSLNKL
jgi:aminotransferase